jgi:hypothetical protein
MAVQVKVTVTGAIEDVLRDVRAQAARNKVKLSGDATSGSFSGDGIEGAYAVSGRTITVHVTRSPWYAPDAVVRNAIEDWFRGK